MSMQDPSDLSRRELLKAGAALGTAAIGGAVAVAGTGLGCNSTPTSEKPQGAVADTPGAEEPSAQDPDAQSPDDGVLSVKPLGFPWVTSDPFLFCAYHSDAYPAGNEVLGPAASLEGRNIGRDFAGKNGWRMYHGDKVPGFPQHPHRGFETVSIVRRGLVDHSDSLGATARYGEGDVQWMTAGGGIQHAEMFPLLDRDGHNPLEMFQVWLNLPARDKLVAPHFKMMWSKTIPHHVATDAAGNKTVVTVIAGKLANTVAPAPAPKSWAARPESDVAIWTIAMDAGANFTLPAAQPGSSRTAYFFRGSSVTVARRALHQHVGVSLRANAAVTLTAGPDPVELLMLQGKPIGERIARHGPFVMNTEAEIRQAYEDYRSTRFGGWPWPGSDPVHERTEGRFAKHADGRIEKAT
jgi:redox-sensitive bicupin YhaK (pirin superfamily)